MTPSEILRKAKALIDTPEKWTQEEYARNKDGIIVYFKDITACKFCSWGALAKAHNSDDAEEVEGEDAFYWLAEAMGVRTVDVARFNDNHTHAEVMAKWDEAIALAEADEKEGV